MHSMNRTVMDSQAATLVQSALPINQISQSHPQEEISKGTVTINSWNEWDPLKHVIVGRADGAVVQAPEIAVQRDWPEHGFPLGSSGPIPQHMVDAANYQLDNLANILRKRGVRSAVVPANFPLGFAQELAASNIQLRTTNGLFWPEREAKTDEELKLMRRALQIRRLDQAPSRISLLDYLALAAGVEPSRDEPPGD